MSEQLYAVEYRNMRTAVHGLFVYDDLDSACAVDDYLAENAESYYDSMDDPMVQEYEMKAEHMVDVDYSEINYRDVAWDDDMHEYVYRDPWDNDLPPIIVVNSGHVVHDLYC